MKPEISGLLEISDFYGSNKDYVIAGGGNTSYKDEQNIWVKASGSPLAGLSEEDLVCLSREKLGIIARKTYSEDPVRREDEVKSDLYAAMLGPGSGKRPSVETSLHNIIKYKFVVHLHPTLINGLLCSRNARSITINLFGDKVLFVPYTDPGYTLFKQLASELNQYREKHGDDPHVIFLENHGSFVSADNTEEIRLIYDEIIVKISGTINPEYPYDQLPYNKMMDTVIPAIRMLLTDDSAKVVRYRHNSLIAKYYSNHLEFQKISHPLTPDIIVYCKYRYIYVDQVNSPERILESFRNQLERFVAEYNFKPKVIVIKNMGVFAVEDSYAAAESVLDVYEDLVRISYYASSCGGIKMLTPDQVSFIDQWEVENYRRKVSSGGKKAGCLNNKTVIVTGGAQGFGAGIAESLFSHKANIVIADLNEESGSRLVADLNKYKQANRAVFVQCDVSDPESVKELISSTVSEFGGLDIIISNAGILRAGGLDEMEPDTFSMTTDVNYKGYFHCAKYASRVMKIQNSEKPEYFTDIIQINSKSGLRGSKRNFAYAGAKFGGIGLTQSFALELAPYRIKVNSICPGNFYEGPLWSDSKHGLFVQYLRTGKVPGAKTIDDVRQYYEEQVPMGRGCKVSDIMKAILYVIDQEYETGQAIPVTGGQVMLG